MNDSKSTNNCTVKVILPVWDDSPINRKYLNQKAANFVHYIQETDKIWYRRIIIERFFISYANMAMMRKYQSAITRVTAIKVFEFAVLIGGKLLIPREEIESLWLKVMKVNLWEFTRSSLLFTRGSRQ